MTTLLPEPKGTSQCYAGDGTPYHIPNEQFTEAQVLEYGRAEFERALLLAMNATRAFGSTGDVISVCIGNLKREDEK
jgi:hypothetical protein